MKNNFSIDVGSGAWGEARLGFEMIQAHYIYCAPCFYYYCISSTSVYQALDPKGWGPLV